MTKEQAIEILKCFKDNEIQRDKLETDNRCGGWKIGRIYKYLELNIAIETVLSMLEEKDKQIGLYIDNIMIHQQVKTIRKMCCPSCPIGEKACTYSGIHRNCIKQYFENKRK